jgi:hypothetical protein
LSLQIKPSFFAEATLPVQKAIFAALCDLRLAQQADKVAAAARRVWNGNKASRENIGGIETREEEREMENPVVHISEERLSYLTLPSLTPRSWPSCPCPPPT